MSWSSRIGSWSGRFSPFGRSPTQGNPEVSDSDYSYITNEDLKRSQAEQAQSAESGPPRDTDVLVIRSKRISYPVHFPAYSIDRGELLIGDVRDQAAKKTGTADARRIKLLYRGKVLKDDVRTCRAEGLREGAEVMCSIADLTQDYASSSDSEEDGVPLDGSGEGDTPKRKRNRNRNKKKKGKKPAESLPVPPSETSRSSSPKPPSPATPLAKLDLISHKFQELLPDCVRFTTNPPTDPAKKQFEHKKLGEIILAQVLLKLDAVEVEGDSEARARRKELVRDAQRVLNGLDDAMK